MKQREKRNIVIGLLCVMVVFMSVGYAVLSQNLKINGTANITGSWKIEITSITPQSINEGVSVYEEILPSKTEGSFEANLKKPTDAVIYTVTVENKGTIDAVLESITPEDYTEGDIKYTTTGKEECKNLNGGATCDFTIKVEYVDTGAGQQPTPNGTKVSQDFTIKYVQKTSGGNSGEVTPDGGGDVVDGESDFLVTSDGMLLSYLGSEANLVVPTEINGIKITKIAPAAFNKSDFLVLEFSDGVLRAIIKNDEKSEIIRNYLLDEGIEEYSRDNIATSLVESDIIFSDEDAYVVLEDGSVSRDTNRIEFHIIESLDLSQMIYLEEIREFALVGINGIKEECPNLEGSCGIGKLTSLKLPMNGVLKSIGDWSFMYNKISELIIPSSVTYIGDSAFDVNNPYLTKITIKRADSTGMTLGDDWNGNAEVVYDPN